MPEIRIVGDGEKNVTVWVRGEFATDKPIELFAVGDMVPVPKSLVLGSVIWCIEEKAKCCLWAGDGSHPGQMLLFMESRNSIRLDRPIQMPPEWDGAFYLSPRGEFERSRGLLYWIVLDFDKVRR